MTEIVNLGGGEGCCCCSCFFPNIWHVVACKCELKPKNYQFWMWFYSIRKPNCFSYSTFFHSLFLSPQLNKNKIKRFSCNVKKWNVSFFTKKNLNRERERENKFKWIILEIYLDLFFNEYIVIKHYIIAKRNNSFFSTKEFIHLASPYITYTYVRHFFFHFPITRIIYYEQQKMLWNKHEKWILLLVRSRLRYVFWDDDDVDIDIEWKKNP